MKPRGAAGPSAVVLVTALVLAGCQAAQGIRSGSPEVVLDDLHFAPNRLDAKVGVPLVVRLTNRGTERHDLNLPSVHMPGLEGIESILDPGESRTITLTFDAPGTHTFTCSL